jgi:hypothetical protein
VDELPKNGGFALPGGLARPKRARLDAQAVSAGLARTGLSCDLNTIRTVEGLARDVIIRFPREGVTLVAAAARDRARDYEYRVDPANAALGRMTAMLSRWKELQDRDLCHVAHNRVESQFRSSTIGALKEIFTVAGTVVGSVQNGHIDSDQLGALVGDMVGMLGNGTARDFRQRNTQSLFLVQKTDGETTPSVAGLVYSYDFTVRDVANKKEASHLSSYLVEQWNVAFDDPTVLEDVYQQLHRQSGSA